MQQKAFSLVELSIVLVILGLLVGGILTGQSLIRAAELRSVTTEYQNYQTAVMTFRDKYFALPGDMNNATDFWGASANCPGTTTQGTTDGTTCNGDDNGEIDVSAASNEYFRLWQHLANAGLIEGNYNGVAGPGHTSEHAVANTNVPASKLAPAVWYTRHRNPISGHGSFFDGAYGNSFMLGAVKTNDEPGDPVLTPEEAWGIDKKVDDGLPAQGRLMVRVRNNCTHDAGDVTPDSDALDSEYNLADTSLYCALVFRNAF